MPGMGLQPKNWYRIHFSNWTFLHQLQPPEGEIKQGRIHGNPVADGLAGAVMRKPLTIQKGYGTNRRRDGRTDRHGKVQSCVSATENMQLLSSRIQVQYPDELVNQFINKKNRTKLALQKELNLFIRKNMNSKKKKIPIWNINIDFGCATMYR